MNYVSARMFAVPLMLAIVTAADADPIIADFIRGDANYDTHFDVSDSAYVFNFLFLGGPAPPSLDAADLNDSGSINISDPIYGLNYLILGGATPLPPHGVLGTDPTADGLPDGPVADPAPTGAQGGSLSLVGPAVVAAPAGSLVQLGVDVFLDATGLPAADAWSFGVTANNATIFDAAFAGT